LALAAIAGIIEDMNEELNLDDLLRREEAKRNAHWNPAERWRVIQETIAWADAQAPVPRNSKARCLELQRAKLAEESASGSSSQR